MPQIPEFRNASLVVHEVKNYAHLDEGQFQSPELRETHQEPPL